MKQYRSGINRRLRFVGLSTNMKFFLRALRTSRRAATAIEYGLIAALIAIAAIAAMQGLGNQLKKTFGNVTSNMKAS